MFSHSQQEPDPLPSRTNEPCPFCGQLIQWDGDQLFCAPCLRTWADWEDVRFDRHEVKYAERKAAQVAAEEAAMWEYYEGDDQRGEDSSGYAAALDEGLERIARHEAELSAYLAALTEWRRSYEEILAENRAEVVRVQMRYNERFTRCRIRYAAIAPEVEPYCEEAWVLGSAADDDGYWSVCEREGVFRRKIPGILWIEEPIKQSLMEAGEGPWRAVLRAWEAGKDVFCLHFFVEEVRKELTARMHVLPEQPKAGQFVFPLSQEDAARVRKVLDGMALVDIPF